jgi:aspartyl protease family protein
MLALIRICDSPPVARRQGQEMLGKAVAFLVIALIIGGVAARVADTRSKSAAASAAIAAAPAPVSAPATIGNSRSIALSRGNGGHFWADARVDGRRLEMVVDTGATQIALRATDAARLGIHPAARDYVVKVATVNGITRAALVQLRAIELGNIVVRDVPALVHPDESLGVNLLGMSFLSRLRWTHEHGKLVLEQ